MIMAGVFRLCTCMAVYFSGGAGWRTVPSVTASITLPGTPDNRLTKNRFSKGRSLSSQISELRPLVCCTQGITPKPRISGLAHWGG
ncbi:hypothetical protein SAMN04490194_1110 [Pseudomonas migulae]|uniref:Uncharacterized protein n=1 Tax=Pseudomonas migulae TaxID=78543 RepID=A0A1H5GBI5_9PSED|nr:hypothetical protein SAMN04490194_1110 [Pseudomonas migulae]